MMVLFGSGITGFGVNQVLSAWCCAVWFWCWDLGRAYINITADFILLQMMLKSTASSARVQVVLRRMVSYYSPLLCLTAVLLPARSLQLTLSQLQVCRLCLIGS